MTRSTPGPSAAVAIHRLSKSRYVAGLQCQKMLWWKVHEPDAPELAPTGIQHTVFERGNQIGELARTYVPGGVLIDLPRYEVRERVAATAQALAGGARAVYEASFLADDIFVSVDILERRKSGFVLTEVKSTTKVKDEHFRDVAVQVHVVRRAGVPVARAEIMHLNRECRHPRLDNLFVREAVTRKVGPHLREVSKRAAAQLAMLAGPRPDVPIGAHCAEPYECAFIARCHPELPDHHVSTLYQIRRPKLEKLLADGIETLDQIPADFEASPAAQRQIDSVRENQIVVERGLRRALAKFKRPIAFLDFETVQPAVPVWPGCRPYDQIPVQLSCHVLGRNGALRHYDWLASGPSDPRPAFAAALLEACDGAPTIVAYNVPFERGRVEELAEAIPALKRLLAAITKRLVDLLPIVRNHVYHPAFHGGFGIKSVLPALVPALGYDDLVIQEGASASAALEAMLLDEVSFDAAQLKKLRVDLLRYCERDTMAMVRLYQRLLVLAAKK